MKWWGGAVEISCNIFTTLYALNQCLSFKHNDRVVSMKTQPGTLASVGIKTVHYAPNALFLMNSKIYMK